MRKKSKSRGPSATAGGDTTSNSSSSVNRPFISPLLPATPSSDTSSSGSFGSSGVGTSPLGFGSFIGYGLFDSSGSDTLARTRPFSSIRSSDTSSSSSFGLGKFGTSGTHPFTAPPLSDSDASDSETSEKASGYGKSFGTSGSFDTFGTHPFTAPPLSDSDASDSETSEKASSTSDFGKFGSFGTSGSRPFIAPPLSDSDASDSETSEKASGYGKSFGTSGSFDTFGTHPFTAPPLSDSDASDSETSEKASGTSDFDIHGKASLVGNRSFIAPPLSDSDAFDSETSEKASSVGFSGAIHSSKPIRKASLVGTRPFIAPPLSDSDTSGSDFKTSYKASSVGSGKVSSGLKKKRKYPAVKGSLTVTEKDATKLNEKELDWLQGKYTKAVFNIARGIYTSTYVSIYKKLKGKDPPVLPKSSDTSDGLIKKRLYPIKKGPLIVTEEDGTKLTEKDLDWLENTQTRAVQNATKGNYTKKFVEIFMKVRCGDPLVLLKSSDTSDGSNNLSSSIASPSDDSKASQLFDGYLRRIFDVATSNISVDERAKVIGPLVRKIGDQHNMLKLHANALNNTVLSFSHKRELSEGDDTLGDDNSNAQANFKEAPKDSSGYRGNKHPELKRRHPGALLDLTSIPEADKNLIECHLIYVIACAETKKILYIGKSNNGVFQSSTRELKHCFFSLRDPKDRKPSDEWHPSYPAIAKALRKNGVLMLRPFFDLTEDVALYYEASMITVNDGLNYMPGTLKERFIGRSADLKKHGKILLAHVKKMLTDQEFPVYKADNYKNYRVEWKLRKCDNVKCNKMSPVRGSGLCEKCDVDRRNAVKLNNEYQTRDGVPLDYAPKTCKTRGSDCPQCNTRFIHMELRIRFTIYGQGGYYYHPQCLTERSEFKKSWKDFKADDFETLQVHEQELLKKLFPVVDDEEEDESECDDE